MNDEKTIRSILNRLDIIEKQIFSKKNKQIKVNSDFSGPKGGILLLVSKNFFNKKKSVVETMKELEERGYSGYVVSVVQTTLNRLSTKTGPLIAVKDNGKKMYVIRK